MTRPSLILVREPSSLPPLPPREVKSTLAGVVDVLMHDPA
jgi:hypothetical protein